MKYALFISSLLAFLLFSSCSNHKSENTATKVELKDTAMKQTNPAVYFEIPVTNMERAKKFYTVVFKVDFTEEIIDNNQMALFPFDENGTGITGALAKGEIYKPSKTGTLIYFHTADIDSTLNAAVQNGGKILYPKTSTGQYGYVAEFEDTEGNRIGVSQRNN
jgi:uncharacterized protein